MAHAYPSFARHFTLFILSYLYRKMSLNGAISLQWTEPVSQRGTFPFVRPTVLRECELRVFRLQENDR